MDNKSSEISEVAHRSNIPSSELDDLIAGRYMLISFVPAKWGVTDSVREWCWMKVTTKLDPVFGFDADRRCYEGKYSSSIWSWSSVQVLIARWCCVSFDRASLGLLQPKPERRSFPARTQGVSLCTAWPLSQAASC
jgi:hypothetical protein